MADLSDEEARVFAQRFVAHGLLDNGRAHPDALDGREWPALLGWVRRRMATCGERLTAWTCEDCGTVWWVESGDDIGGERCSECGESLPREPSGTPRPDSEDMSLDVMRALGFGDGIHGQAWTLCEQAGWPS